MRQKNPWIGPIALTVLFVGCGSDDMGASDGMSGSGGMMASDDDGNGADALQIIGLWSDSSSGSETTHRISAEAWTQRSTFGDSTFQISSYDNDAGVVLALNDAQNEFFPGRWSKFQWTWFEDGLWYCQSAFDADSEDIAARATADASDPTTTGCSSFPWSPLQMAD